MFIYNLGLNTKNYGKFKNHILVSSIELNEVK